MKLSKETAAGIIFCLALAGTAYAHNGATGVVEERMHHMKMIAESMKKLGAIFKGETAYDAEAVRAEAYAIKDHGGDTLTSLFPEGSLDKPTEALPVIWEDWERFSALAAQLEAYSAGLALAADNATGMPAGMHGQGMMGGHSSEELGKMPPDMVFRMLGKTCSDCHTQFREKKN